MTEITARSKKEEILSHCEELVDGLTKQVTNLKEDRKALIVVLVFAFGLNILL